MGVYYTLPHALGGLYAGALARKGNRKMMLISVIAMLSALQVVGGVFDSFLIFAAVRILNGVLSSAINPVSFSLVSDFFPAERRTTANSILSVANYAGIAMSSLSILLIKNIGWRQSYMTMGAVGFLGALLLMPFKNPTAQSIQEDQKQTIENDPEQVDQKKKLGFIEFLK